MELKVGWILKCFGFGMQFLRYYQLMVSIFEVDAIQNAILQKIRF